MKFSTQPIFDNHDTANLAILFAHSPRRTQRKTTLSQILSAVNTERVFGHKIHKDGKDVYFASPKSPHMSIVTAFSQLVSPSEWPEIGRQFFSELPQRRGYVQTVKFAQNSLDKLSRDQLRCSEDKVMKKVLLPANKYDPARTDKLILQDVIRSIYLSICNQYVGSQLVNDGEGLYLIHNNLKACMMHPEAASDEKLSNSLILLRLVGLITLAKDNELTAEGKRLSQTMNNKGKSVNNHRIYIVHDFSQAHWEDVADNFFVDLNVRIGKSGLLRALNGDVNAVEHMFPDITSGPTLSEIETIQSMIDKNAGSNQIICTYQLAVSTIQQLGGRSKPSAVKTVDSILNLRMVEAKKMTEKQAAEMGYVLDGFKNLSPQAKVIVPIDTDALLSCLTKVSKDKQRAVKALNM
ncbi:hypothetical protein [Schleiferilactobacillus harbinensis]|uniref:hypothetical protein n=1 Tax=Schleiferilactobacillus harbinensis TaxID=304207 RepID=UPI00116E0EE4|nr:hypothetical protein [Schleiferilactobacillus harbinensis]GEK06635.1 hypothetical protein LHA01_18740 [Schleiferilactobacillus harbinensis]